jgi:hypothetical protein
MVGISLQVSSPRQRTICDAEAKRVAALTLSRELQGKRRTGGTGMEESSTRAALARQAHRTHTYTHTLPSEPQRRSGTHAERTTEDSENADRSTVVEWLKASQRRTWH